MSLTTCLKKMGKSLHAQDKADIYAAARKHRSDGLSAIEAARKAVADQLAKADARVSAEESAQRESNESGPEAPADAGVSRSEPLTRAEIDADVKRVFGTAKPLTRLINSGAVSLITKAQAIQRGLGSAKSLEGVKGLHDGTRGYLITDELQPNEVAGVLIHEIGVHHSMERILGAERFDKLQKAMESFRARGDKDVLAAYAAVPKDTPAHHVNHEAIAYLAEHSANHSITQKLVDATKLFLNRLGVPMSWIKAEPAAVRSIARESLLAESRRGNGSVRYNGRDTLYQKVWHGTPHRDIEKTGFSLQKIGTGEGAQAYGWGLYFASLREVADGYRVALTADQNRRQFAVAAAIASSKWFKPGLVVNGKKYYDRMELQGDIDRRDLTSFDMPADVAKVFTEKLAEPSGNLYRVDIPEDSDLMDWDKPLSEQPEKVKAALAPLIEQVRDTKRFSDDPTGERIYNALSVRLAEGEAPGKLGRGAKAASEALLRAGIPGLRYLDGNSRSKGEGSANYVIWDETLLTPEKAQITPYYSKRTDDEDQTQTAAFKRWFAGSKVVDSEGKPLVVYHGTKSVITEFDGSKTADGGFHFGTSAQANMRVSGEGKNLMPVYLSASSLQRSKDLGGNWKAKIKAAQASGKDGIVYLNRYEGLSSEVISRLSGEGLLDKLDRMSDTEFRRAVPEAEDSYIVFHPTQIKSAIGNNGNFDPANPDIRFSRRKSDADLMARQQAAESGMQLYQPARTDQTQTTEFKRWFAGSKVVDSEGKPLVVYHGASTVFDVFDASRAGENTGAANTAAGFFFTNDEVQADSYVGVRGRRVDAFIRIENPLHLTGLEYDRDASGALNDAIAEHVGKPQSQVDQDDATEYVAYLKRRGFDGIEVEIPDGTYTPLFNWIVFDPTQIKSATGNNGQFDPGNPDIRFSRRKSDADLMARQQAAESGMQLYQPARTDQTQTTEFKRWFAGSKVVDSEGKPLVVYHGTNAEFDAFDPSKVGSAYGTDEQGFFFTSSEDEAQKWADRAPQKGSQKVLPVYLNIDNAWEIDAPDGVGPVEYFESGRGPFNRGHGAAVAYGIDSGYDGMIVRGEGETMYIAFRPEQIKSATGNNGQFDPGNPNILKSRRTPSDAQKDAAARRAVAVNTLGGPTTGGAIGWNFDAGEWEGKSGTVRRARAALDDKMIAWRDVQNSIAEHLGNAVPDAQNVYRLENLMHGRVKEGIDALEEKQVVPLVKAMQEAKITPAMLEEYLYALHAKERNAQIAKINPKMPDGGSGMTNAEADAILAKPLPNGMKSIAKRAQNIVRQTRKRLLDHGIITQDQFDAMESQYQNYVPLRGKTVGENEFDSGGSGAGRGIDGRPSPVKQAFGRGAGNRAENILGEIIGDAQRSIIAAEKARVGRAVMRIVLANPNPKLWTVEPVLTERKLDSTGEVYEAVVQDWSDPSIVAVRHRGKVYKVQINHAPLAKALNLVGVDQIGAVTRAAGALNRYFSAVLTRYNPAFIPVNAARDALFGLTGLAVEHGEVTAMKAALYYPKAIRAAWREARRLPPKSQADTYAREFSEDGGKTGYVSMPSVEELQRKIGSGRFGGYSPQGIGRAAQAVGDLVGAMNDSVENALRLSAYVTLREQGMAREKAASYAKELTVNFNRKGSEGTKLNSWFLFYNASMQGIKRTGALMKSPKTWGYLGALTAAQIAAVMYAMGQEDDDGTPIWDKVPDHVKQRNLVFTWLDDGGEQKILTIPMPYGLNVFPYFAGRVADGMMHAENRPRDRAMSIAADTVSTAVQSFSPVPLDDGAMGLLPTALRIPLSIQVNRDDFGRQIRKENPFGKFDVPRASIGKPDTLEMFKVMATGLNRIGGGDERTPPPMSAFDVAPEDIEYVLEKLGGGTGKFIIDMATVGQKATGELPVETRDIPIAKRFFTNVNEPAAQQAMFYERREAIERDADMVRDVYEKDGPEAAIALLRSTPSLSGADFRRYKESDPKKGHRKGGIVVVDGRPQLVVRRPDSVYGRYKAAAEETAEVNGAMRNAYADSPMSLRPSGERDKRLKELADKRMAAQRIFNAAWNRDVVGGE